MIRAVLHLNLLCLAAVNKKLVQEGSLLKRYTKLKTKTIYKSGISKVKIWKL
jgi:hypothetical protein